MQGLMLTLKEEKLFSYCMEELRLLIEKPCQHDALLDRLSNIKESFEVLYVQIVMEKR
jgi:hypothetical protein